MRVIARHELPRLLRAAGLEPATRAFSDCAEIHRLTIREAKPLPFVDGPHRKIVYADGRVEGPVPVADRPALSQFVAAIFGALPVPSVLVTVEEGTFWLNNRTQAAYLHRVPDAQHVARFLRARGLTDKFRGGFQVPRPQFTDILPRLAANTYAGGGDVQFAALDAPQCRLTVLACHHFDLHLTTLDADLLSTLASLAPQHNVHAETLIIPEL